MVCNTCGGRGYTIIIRECTRCHGSGRVNKDACVQCKGGKVEYKVPCSHCRGSGK
jgi:DnaJ-class molecular chaperone